MLNDKDPTPGMQPAVPGVFPVGAGVGAGVVTGTTVGGLGVPMSPVAPVSDDITRDRSTDITDVDPLDAETQMDNDDVIDTLNTLIETCYDGEYGFQACTERTHSQNLKSVFAERIRECSHAASELASEVVRLGGKPEDSGTVSGTVHRGWVAVRDMLTSDSDNDLAILNECERGEDIALARYRKACKQALPYDVRAMVERQLHGVQQNHDMIKQLRDSHKLHN